MIPRKSAVYESTYEQIKYNITQREKAKGIKKNSPKNIFYLTYLFSEPVDMFSDIDPPSVGGATVGGALDEVQWEYKWKDDDDKIHGPFTSTQMAEWQGQGSVTRQLI